MTAKWTTPETAVTGATKYLVTFDPSPVGVITVPSCYRNNFFPVGRGSLTQQNVRELDLWQVFTIGATRYLRTSTQTFNLGDAPTIRLNSDLSSSGETSCSAAS